MQRFNYVRFKNQQETLLDFLCRRFPYQDRSGWQGAIDRGSLMINDEPTQGELVLETGHVIGYQRERGDEPEVDRRYRVIFEDDGLLVVEKSGNLPVVESGKYYQNTLIEILKEEREYPKLFQVHRLDRETSGVLVIAKSAEIATRFGEQFSQGKVKKRYQALLVGDLEEEILVDQPIKKVKATHPDMVRIRQVIEPTGKASQTRFTPIKRSLGLSLVSIELYTGRTHQIRVHAEFLGLPVLGDKLYGQEDQRFVRLLKGEEEPVFGPYGKIDHQLLHASSLEFTHPVTGETVCFESPCDPWFSEFESVAPLFND